MCHGCYIPIHPPDSRVLIKECSAGLPLFYSFDKGLTVFALYTVSRVDI